MTSTKSLLIFLLYFIICFSSISRSTSLSSKDLLGISPEDEKYYKTSSGTIKCRDGSKKFTKAQLNDDFCDCADGTDEPGTSACPNGKFYCRNAGHVPVYLYSSRVNDGICDCCDGSDEYDGKVKCSNSCWEAGKVARDRLMKKIATYQEGVTLRKQEVEKSKLAVAKDEAELSKLQDEEKILKGLVQQLRERKEQIEKAEEKERLQKEKEEKAKKEAEEAKMKESNAEEKADTLEEPIKSSDDDVEPMKSSDDDVIGLLKDSPSVQDVIEVHEKSVLEVEHSDNSGNEESPSNEVHQHSAKEEEESLVAHETDLDTGSKGEDATEDTDSLSREELGRIVGSRWTGKKTEQHSEEPDAAKDDDHDHDNYEEPQSDANNEEYNSYDSETEDDRHKYDDADDDTDDHMEDIAEDDHEDSSSSHNYESDGETDFSDITSTSSQSWLEKIQNTVKKILQSVNLFQTPVDKSEAAHVRKEFDESMAKLAKMQSRISSLTQKLKHDFGPEKEFYSFYGQCLEIKQNKYVYKICPFKQATQEEGHSTSRLGNWDKFEDSYRIMHFSNGDKCWNGPDRSMKVKLRCGLKNEVTDVGEPSRCEYEALLFTPALCVEEKLKELQDKLDSLNKEQPQGHDEL